MKYSIELKGVTKEYNDGSSTVTALKGIDLTVAEGKDIVVMGPSGSGKSTLLQLIGALDTATSGSITVAGQDIRELDDAAAAEFRNQTIGFVFQSFHLQSYSTAVENVALPLLLLGTDEKTALEQAHDMLKRVGLAHRASHEPSQLSGGEMQRVAIARALVTQPKILLADEPTGNLDSKNATAILDLFKELSTKDVSFVIVTHDEKVAKRYKHVIKLEDGLVA